MHLPGASNTLRNGAGTSRHIPERAVFATKLGFRSYCVDARWMRGEHACISQRAGLILFRVSTCPNLQAHQEDVQRSMRHFTTRRVKDFKGECISLAVCTMKVKKKKIGCDFDIRVTLGCFLYFFVSVSTVCLPAEGPSFSFEVLGR